jgi:SAM-dependent methyltransferase
MDKPHLDPTPLMQILAGARMQAALIAVLEHRVCAHLAEGPCDAATLAKRAGIAPRGAQALLDVLVALHACTVENGVYANGPLADAFLVPGRPEYLGDEEVAMFKALFTTWGSLPEVARTGRPVHENDSPAMLDLWTSLTPTIARRGRPVAEEAVRRLGLAEGAPSLLDVGGGAALYSLALLRQNPRARATQLDWPHVNRIAQKAIDAAGLAARFATIDGDFRVAPTGGPYDVAVLSNIVHQESEESAVAVMKRLREALVPGGRLLVSEFVVDDGRSGPPFALLFNLNMLLNTSGGRSYERRDLARMMKAAGFGEATFHAVGPVSTLVVAARG